MAHVSTATSTGAQYLHSHCRRPRRSPRLAAQLGRLPQVEPPCGVPPARCFDRRQLLLKRLHGLPHRAADAVLSSAASSKRSGSCVAASLPSCQPQPGRNASQLYDSTNPRVRRARAALPSATAPPRSAQGAAPAPAPALAERHRCCRRCCLRLCCRLRHSRGDACMNMARPPTVISFEAVHRRQVR